MSLPSALSHLPEALLPLDDVSGSSEGRQSAVLLLLYPHEERIHFVLTRRPDTLARHAGQISLPGGVREAQDNSLMATALREAQEEIGVETDTLVLLGRLHPYQLNVSGYLIHPYVAWSAGRPSFHPDPHEVAELIEVPMEQLLDPNLVLEEVWEIRNGRWLVTFYRFGPHTVWGATATILGDFASRLESSLASRLHPPGSVRPAP